MLVVDHSTVAADSMAILLGLYGYEARTVYSATEVLDATLDFRPHAVLLEICMPLLDGHAIARQIRDDEQLREVVVVAVTGYADHSGLPRQEDSPFDHYLLKPVDMGVMDSLLRETWSPSTS